MPTCRTLRVAFLPLALVLIATPQLAAAWPADVVVTNAPGPQAEPEIITDGAGGAIVFWRDYTDVVSSASLPVYARRVLASGVADPAWPDQGRLIFEAGSFRGEGIVPDGAGGAFVGWATGDSRYARVQHVLANGTFDPMWPAAGIVVRDAGATNRLYAPTLLSDGAGGAIVAWREDVSSLPSILAKHVSAAGLFDPAWPAFGRLVSHDVSGGFSMVTDHVGGAVFAWDRSSSASFGLAHHLMADGTLDAAWPAQGREFGVKGFGAGVLAVPDDVGGIVVLWSLYTQSEGYAQHILANGSVDPSWPSDGLVYGSNSPYRALVEDGAGGVISSWLYMPDPENNNAYFVYGQHVLDEGTQDPQWPEDALYVANTDSDSPDNLRAVSDGAGGAIVAFEGYRFFALIRVLASGAVDPSWPVNGLRLSNHASAIPALVPDGASGVIVAWREDHDSNNLDIHAQRVSVSGTTVGVPELPIGREPMLARVTPTPTQGECTIGFTMPAAGRVELAIHDIGGRKICDLLRADVSPGAHTVTWNGSVEGRRAPNGVYFVRMQTRSGLQMRRLVLMR